MARDNDSPNSGGTRRDRYRDNDDVRQIDDPATRNDVKSDSRNEARGDARENVGNHARDTARDDAGPEGNDRQRSRRDGRDEFDEDLERHSRGAQSSGMSEMARETRTGAAGFAAGDRPANMEGLDDRHGWRSHDRQGHAQSPVELTHNEAPKQKEGHPGVNRGHRGHHPND
jgi:hypothetical protein